MGTAFFQRKTWKLSVISTQGKHFRKVCLVDERKTNHCRFETRGTQKTTKILAGNTEDASLDT